MSHPKHENWTVPVIKCAATQNQGVDELIAKLRNMQSGAMQTKKTYLLAEKAYPTDSTKKDKKSIQKKALFEAFSGQASDPQFNLYRFADQFNNWKIAIF